MKSYRKLLAQIALALAAMLLVALVSGCGSSPDATEDPLGKYSTDVDSLLPFATADPSLASQEPWAPDYTTAPPATVAPTPQSGYPNLSYGASGNEVSQLQGRLKALGYFNGTLDGNYGESTGSAVRLFQEQLGVSKTGIASSQLQNFLFAADAPRFGAGSQQVEEDPFVYYDDEDEGADEYEGGDDFVPETAPTKKPTARPTTKPAPTPRPANPTYETLAKGDRGDAVSRLQRSLKSLGYYTGAIDGDYGNGTVTAVKRFQKMYDQKQTGVATAALQKKLFSGDALTYVPPKPTPAPTSNAEYVRLERGDTGERVKALQRRLKKLGYFDGEIGGNYLDLTTAAVKRFQKALGLNQTGVATVALQKRLFASDAPPASTPKPTATPKPSTYSTLKEGSSGKAVERLQKRLKELGYYTGQVTGGYGKNTTAAVKLFQKTVDLRQTGTATAALQRLLFSDEAPERTAQAAAPTEKPKYVKLKKGDTGERVKTLQRRLKQLGFFDGEIGGNYLTKTEAAVKAFQKAIGVKQDGIATTDLQEKLFSDEAPSKGSSGSSLKALKYKDKGDAVYALQVRLIELGFMDDFGKDGEGYYGAVTRDGVIEAQLARGFDSDGNADLEFMRFIMSDKAYDYSPLDFERG